MIETVPDPVRGKDVIAWAVPVTRALNALKDKFGASARNERDHRSSFAPWTFSCVESGSERTGGWYNCRLQVGFDLGWASPELGPDTDHVIAGCDHTEDGVHYLEVQLGDPDAVEIKVAEEGGAPRSDYVRGIIRIKLAAILDGKATEYLPHINPVIYKYV